MQTLVLRAALTPLQTPSNIVCRIAPEDKELAMANHEPLHPAERQMRSIKEHFPRIDEYIECACRQGRLGFPDFPQLKEDFPHEELASYAEDHLVSLKTIEQTAERIPRDEDSLAKAALEGSLFVPPHMVTAYRRWQDCKHIYRFEAALTEEPLGQPLDDDLPKELFDCLPYSIFYIDCSSDSKSEIEGLDMAGFWVFRATVPSKATNEPEDRLCMVLLGSNGNL